MKSMKSWIATLALASTAVFANAGNKYDPPVLDNLSSKDIKVLCENTAKNSE